MGVFALSRLEGALKVFSGKLSYPQFYKLVYLLIYRIVYNIINVTKGLVENDRLVTARLLASIPTYK